MVKNITFVVETLLLLSLAAVKFRFYFLKISSDSVFVVLTDKVHKTVNFVQVRIEVVESILKIRFNKKHLVAQGIVYSLKVVQVL